jgi:hypothetical protein
MGFEDEVEQSLPRPCRQTDGGFKRTFLDPGLKLDRTSITDIAYDAFR